jgi:hypothetical protein
VRRWCVDVGHLTNDQMAFFGYVLVAENEDFAVYRHYGEDIIVSKSDRFILVDDLNDALNMGGARIVEIEG